MGMNNDLISRSAVQDIICARLKSCKRGTLEHRRLYSVWKSVKELPVAYDVDKAIAKIDEKWKEYAAEYKEGTHEIRGLGFSRKEEKALIGMGTCRFAIRVIKEEAGEGD